MSDPERVLNAEVRARLDEHLDAVERALAEAGVSHSDRRAIRDEVEAQACEMLWQRAEGEPTEQHMKAVLAELDDPEAYREAAEPIGQAGATPAPVAGPRIHPFALWALLLPIAELLLAFSPMPIQPKGEWATLTCFGVTTFLSIVFATLAIRDIRREPHRYFGIAPAILGTLIIPLTMLNIAAAFFPEDPLTHVVAIGSSVALSILLFVSLCRLCRPRNRTVASAPRKRSFENHGSDSRTSRALDWLDGRKSWQFVAILYLARWVTLAPIIILQHFFGPGDQPLPAGMSEILEMNPAALFLALVIASPLVETLIECTLPYFVISRVRSNRGEMPARPWDFVLVSALLMALLHPMLAALAPSLITGAFLAYCYAHFARRSAGQAILATTVFHGAINIVGWVMLMTSIRA